MVANIFGKIYAKLGKLEAQSTVSRITREISRITKNIGRAEKQMNQMKRAETNAIKQQFSIFSNNSAITASVAQNATFAGLFKNGVLDYEVANQNKALYEQFNQAVQSQQMFAQNNMQAALDQIEDKYEWMHELEIESMKDEQADLEVEKETAQAQVQMYEGMEKQEGEFAKSNIQNMWS